jgi:hypothetical protein
MLVRAKKVHAFASAATEIGIRKPSNFEVEQISNVGGMYRKEAV